LQSEIKGSCATAGASVLMAVLFVAVFATYAQAGCWLLMKSPQWAGVQAAVGSAKVCEVMPGGPDRTDSVTISRFDVCDAPGGVSLEAEASIECKSSSEAVFQSSATASVRAKVTIDIGTCTVTDSQLELGGTAGELLSGNPEFRKVIHELAQSKLSEFCGK
jgi:hypothetical protein